MSGWWRKLFAGTAKPAPVSLPAAAPLAALDAEGFRQQGNAHLDGGRLEAAAVSYGAALALDPQSVPALINLAYVRLQTGRADEAAVLLAQALQIAPDNVDGHFMLAGVLVGRGEHAAAIEHLERVLQLQPGFELARRDLCRALIDTDQLARARAVAEAGLAIDPRSADLHHDLGNVLLRSNEVDAAVDCYRQALQLQPRSADLQVNLGHALLLAGRTGEALDSLRAALGARPASIDACRLLATSLQRLGALDDAVAAYRMATELDGNDVLAHQNLGVALQQQGKHEAAAASFERVVALQPASPQALCNLGTALQNLGRTEQAADCYRRAQAVAPAHAPAYAHLAALLVDEGEVDAALAQFEQALERDPDYVEARSNQLFVLSFAAGPEDYVAAAREYGRRVARLAQPFEQWAVDADLRPSAETPLKVGLVSGDLRAHPVGFFIASVLPHLAAQGIRLHGFPTSHHHDAVTARLAQAFSSWTPLAGMSDEVAARCIHEQGVQVLIDLSGHTAHNRLPLFAWRPAPLQLSWLGYFASTGVAAIDQVLADPLCVPAGEEAQFTEAVARLPQTRLCFSEPAAREAFPVNELPAHGAGYVTFGCFQNLAKLGDEVLSAWRQILVAVPKAQLRLQSKQLARPAQRERAFARLAAAGIDAARVVLAPPAQRGSYLAAYGEVDIVLDTFPFPGGTTTCEALWMGVPTLTLAGHSMLSRQGEALLRCAGLGDWVAADVPAYVEQAVRRAGDLPALADLRRGLRAQVLASPLFDGPRFAADLAGVLTDLWQRRA